MDGAGALLTGNMTLIDAAARALPEVSLTDALRILVVMAEKRDARYERAASRWVTRVATERQLDATEIRRVLDLVGRLPASPQAVSMELRDICG